jgi:transcriptional regulator with XRE-family HTH domain
MSIAKKVRCLGKDLGGWLQMTPSRGRAHREGVGTMSAEQEVEHSPLVDGEWERGQAIKARRLAAGIKSLREFAKATGVARNAITAAEDGHGSRATYERLEAWLDRFDEETGSDAETPPTGRVVTFEVEGIYGVGKVSVAGPVEDAAELEERFARIVDRLIAGQRGDSSTGGGGS